MILLILGLALWVAAHMFKRLAPDARGALEARLGNGAKGIMAAALVTAVVLMVVGYRGAAFTQVYVPPSWGVHLNNTVMYVAILLFGLGSSKSPLRARLRHPMLLGFLIWALAHLLVNGDLASVVLFGTLALWAVGEIALINRAVPDWTPYAGGTRAGTIRLLVIALVLYLIITGVHYLLGVWPFPGAGP